MDENPHRTDDHHLSEKKSNTDEHKLSTAIAAVTDPKFPLPVLDEKSSALRYVLSFSTLFGLLGAGIALAQFYEVAILQSAQPLVVMGCGFAAVVGALFITGTVWIDWFELVIGYWWLSMPVGALAGLALVLNQEASVEIHETS